jgi:hypothetical protein
MQSHQLLLLFPLDLLQHPPRRKIRGNPHPQHIQLLLLLIQETVR